MYAVVVVLVVVMMVYSKTLSPPIYIIVVLTPRNNLFDAIKILEHVSVLLCTGGASNTVVLYAKFNNV